MRECWLVSQPNYRSIAAVAFKAMEIQIEKYFAASMSRLLLSKSPQRIRFIDRLAVVGDQPFGVSIKSSYFLHISFHVVRREEKLI